MCFSAIEMMDPKMDAGMICNKGKRSVLNFEQSVQVIETIIYQGHIVISWDQPMCVVCLKT